MIKNEITLENLENIHKTIIVKIDILKEISNIMKLDNYINELIYIYDFYLLSMIDVILKYFNEYHDKTNIYNCTIIYKNRLDNLNISNMINIIYNDLVYYISKNCIDNDKIKVLILYFNNNNISYDIKTIQNNDFCLCKNIEIIYINHKENVCSKCGKIYNHDSNASTCKNIDDSQSTKYDFLRHYRIWLEKILATNDKYILKYENEIKTLEKKIFSDYPLEQQRNKLNIYNIRYYLKISNLTKLNDLVPILLKRITMTQPPHITAKEYFDLENLFISVMKIYDSIKKNDEINRKYYPYFIYKIIEFYFSNNKAKLKILNFIHLQKKKNLSK